MFMNGVSDLLIGWIPVLDFEKAPNSPSCIGIDPDSHY